MIRRQPSSEGDEDRLMHVDPAAACINLSPSFTAIKSAGISSVRQPLPIILTKEAGFELAAADAFRK